MRTFLPWTQPLLPAVAACLLEECADADLGGKVMVVRGRNAGRRLLAHLAREAQRRGAALIPPRIVTPGSLDSVLIGRKENVASRVLQKLAWARVAQQADAATLEAVWDSPATGGNGAASLGRFLEQTWHELSASGHDFASAYRLLCQIAPESADREEARWQALGSLLEDYFRCLRSWGLIDPSVFRSGSPGGGADAQMVLVGIVELSPVMVSLLQALPNAPRIFIHAPESEAAGFDAWGRLIPGHWAKRPYRFANREIHVVGDATRQAERCAALVESWRQCGVPTSAITVAVPEAEALACLEQSLRDAEIPVRVAEGRPASRSPVFALLAAVAECLDLPVRYAAMADLVRHPDVEKILGHSVRKLDAYFNAHLPERMEIAATADDPLSEQIAKLVARTRALTRISAEHFADDVTELLLNLYGERALHRHLPEDRAIIHALESIRDTLDALKTLPASALRAFAPGDLLRIVIEVAGGAGIPSEEQPDAVELAGWLEAAANDAPALIVTSVFEGSLPEGASAEPLLHDMLRERLGLPCRASRFARDQYTLWTVTESRREKGRVALIAPRRNAMGEPARPSRLLIAGQENQALAARLIALSSVPKSEPPPAVPGLGLQAPEPDPERMRAFRVFRPTCFRTYLESPRLFYFKHVLGLADQNDSLQELDAALFGTMVHAVLREYGARWLGKGVRPSAAEIEAELEPLLCAHMERQFGPLAMPPVQTQILPLRERLRMFARHQAAAFAEGWQIAYVESDASLIVPLVVDGAPPDVQLKGKIDRIDWHPENGWRVIDYKTAATAKSPEKAHCTKSGWKDLQLPLYMKLLPAVVEVPHGPIDPAQTGLVYFNLPAEWDDAGITEPFPAEKIPEAWEMAEAIVREVCNGSGCREIGDVSAFNDPAFVALCGLNGLTIGQGEEEE